MHLAFGVEEEERDPIRLPVDRIAVALIKAACFSLFQNGGGIFLRGLLRDRGDKILINGLHLSVRIALDREKADHILYLGRKLVERVGGRLVGGKGGAARRPVPGDCSMSIV